jgi:hypothetical protein
MEPDDLYGLALDRFIPERTELARALRADQRREEAAAVAALRKPSVAAWAVNQLVRSQGAAVHELYEAGDALREAQADLLAGSGDGRALRAANERERAAVDTLVAAGRGLLDSDGHELSPSVVERVADTLHAAALDVDAREQVRAGRLERELRHVGLGLGESVFAPAPAPSATPAKPSSTKRRKAAAAPGETKQERAERARAAREQTETAKRLAREHDAARKAARSAETAARRRAERSTHALRAAEERRERAAHALGEADEALAAARAEAQAAAAEHQRARAELERL